MKRILTVLALSTLCLTLEAQPAGGTGGPGGAMGASIDLSAIGRKWLDVGYAADSATQKLDILLPDTGSGPFPVIIAIHGGAFRMGSRRSGELAPMLAGRARGYAVVAVDYRLSGESLFPAAVLDLKAAIRFLRANAAKYSLDPGRFAVWGGSAGGNLAAMLGTSAGVAELEGTAGAGAVSSAVQAVVDWYGPIMFSSMDAQFKALGQTPVMGATSSAGSAESIYLGKTVGSAEAEALVRLASPQTWIDPKDPPFYIQHGTADRNIPITQSKEFAAKLAAAIGADKVRYETLEGAGHGGDQFTTAANVAKILDFLDSWLKK